MARTRTASEEEELSPALGAAGVAQAGISVLAPHGQPANGPYMQLQHNAEDMGARQYELELVDQQEGALAGDGEEVSWAEQQRLLELHVDAICSTPEAFDDNSAVSEAAGGYGALEERVAGLQAQCEAAEVAAVKAEEAKAQLAQQQLELQTAMSKCMSAGEMDNARRMLRQQTELNAQLEGAHARHEYMTLQSAAAARALVGAKAILGAIEPHSSDCARCVAQRTISGNADDYCVHCKFKQLREEQQAFIAAKPGLSGSSEQQPEPEPELQSNPEVHPQRLPATELLSKAVKNVEAFFETRGLGDSSEGAIDALCAVGLPPEEWVLELSDMEEDGSLSSFIQAIFHQKHGEPDPEGASDGTAAALGAPPIAKARHPTSTGSTAHDGKSAPSSPIRRQSSRKSLRRVGSARNLLQRMSSGSSSNPKQPCNFWKENLELVTSYPEPINSSVKDALRLGVPQNYRRVVYLRLSGAEAGCRGDYDGCYAAACVLCFRLKALPVGGVSAIVVEGKFPSFGGELVQYSWMSDDHMLACDHQPNCSPNMRQSTHLH